ncbi:hypothetical protein QR556_00960 [Acinetobacter soli]|uniref:hypothetical protein n=1 Tax=Acinetobacter soli TaxID=487316 RepID=UPI002D7EDA13|nr:hypothetical protein [Acinetobacter soli]MEB4799538.1 hypothetical protein [Acinetobacter soli]
MFLKALVSSISKITHDLGNAVTSQSSASSEGSLNLSLSLSTTVTAVASSISTLPTTISSVVTSYLQHQPAWSAIYWVQLLVAHQEIHSKLSPIY